MTAFADVVDEFKNASPGGKALMLTALIAVSGLGLYIYKQKTANGSTSNAQPTAGTLVPIDSGSGSSGSTSTPTTSGILGFVRAATTTGPFSSYDQSNSGVNLFSSPTTSGSNIISKIPFGAQLQILNIIPSNQGNAGQPIYQVSYNGQTGYVLSQDINQFSGFSGTNTQSAQQIVFPY